MNHHMCSFVIHVGLLFPYYINNQLHIKNHDPRITIKASLTEELLSVFCLLKKQNLGINTI